MILSTRYPPRHGLSVAGSKGNGVVSTSGPSPIVPSGRYVLDSVHSSFGFAVEHNGVSTFWASFERADVELVDGVLSGCVEVGSLALSPVFAERLAAPDFFDAAKAPTVDFRSIDMQVGSDGAALIQGDLTIRGVTRRVSAVGKFAAGAGLHGPVVGFDLESVIDRREFGLVWQEPLPSGADSLGWGVTLQVRLQLTEAASE